MPAVEMDSTRRLPRWLVVTALVLLGARVATGVYEAAHPSIPRSLVVWVPLEKAEAESRERGLPILYDFTAEWCAPCQAMDREVFNDDKSARRINDRYIPVRVTDRMNEDGENLPAVKTLLTRYQVFAFPHIVVVPADGGKETSKRGYDGYTETLRFLKLPTPSGM